MESFHISSHGQYVVNANHTPDSHPDIEFDVDAPIVTVLSSEDEPVTDAHNVPDSNQDEPRIKPTGTER